MLSTFRNSEGFNQTTESFQIHPKPMEFQDDKKATFADTLRQEIQNLMS